MFAKAPDVLEKICSNIPNVTIVAYTSNILRHTVDSKKLEHGCRMIHIGFPSFFGLGLEDAHVPIVCSYCRGSSVCSASRGAQSTICWSCYGATRSIVGLKGPSKYFCLGPDMKRLKGPRLQGKYALMDPEYTRAWGATWNCNVYSGP